MCRITVQPFEYTSTGDMTNLYEMKNSNGSSVTFCDFGASIVSIKIPDKRGMLKDVVLGYSTIKGYEEDGAYFGATVGRCCGRIANGKFEINKNSYSLPINNGKNHLHGGPKGFSRRLWKAKIKEDSLIFSLDSNDGDQGYPGAMNTSVTFTFNDDDTLCIEYFAISNKDTVCNLTNHSYFNLNGHDDEDINNHTLKINADKFIPLNYDIIPTGEILSVENTPFDFREETKISNRLLCENEQLKIANGFDHTFVIDTKENELKLAATARSNKTGIQLDCYTTQPGIHLYTANYVDIDKSIGKDGIAYHKNSAFCFETQGLPDAINHKNFLTTELKANTEYRHITKFAFSII